MFIVLLTKKFVLVQTKNIFRENIVLWIPRRTIPRPKGTISSEHEVF